MVAVTSHKSIVKSSMLSIHHCPSSIILTLFTCPSFHQSKMTKFASFQTHFDPFAGEDHIHKAGRCVTHHFHSRILVMCLLLRLSSPFPSFGGATWAAISLHLWAYSLKDPCPLFLHMFSNCILSEAIILTLPNEGTH